MKISHDNFCTPPISKYYKRFDMDFVEDEILITNGGSEALIFAAIATPSMVFPI